MDTSRAEAFSDGVFAVAITVLVFNLLAINPLRLTYPDLTNAWPSYFAYVVSFLTIGIMWMNHHTMFGHITRLDRAVLVLNLFLLLGVVALPWPTALVARQLQHSGGAPAAVTYGLVMILISVGFAALWIYVVTHAAKLGGRAEPEALRRSIPGFTGGLLVYVAGTVLAAFGLPVAALILYGLLAIYYLFEHLPSPQAPAEGA
ncbi:MAG: TMEM175 family protein [Streptosporangiaceae bacterium]